MTLAQRALSVNTSDVTPGFANAKRLRRFSDCASIGSPVEPSTSAFGYRKLSSSRGAPSSATALDHLARIATRCGRRAEGPSRFDLSYIKSQLDEMMMPSGQRGLDLRLTRIPRASGLLLPKYLPQGNARSDTLNCGTWRPQSVRRRRCLSTSSSCYSSRQESDGHERSLNACSDIGRHSTRTLPSAASPTASLSII